MKKGAYKQLNLTHLEAALSQVLEAAQREQWTYETFLEQALAVRSEVSAPVQAKVLSAGVDMAFAIDDYERAEAECSAEQYRNRRGE